MNEYLRVFRDITQSIEQLLADDRNSLEIQQAATSLKKSVQPCLEELKQSAIKLNRLVVSCSNELYQAESVWLSKPRIAEAAKQEIWEQLGDISGRSTRIRLLATQCRDEAIKLAKKSWNEQIELLRNKWFIDSKGNYKKGISFSNKDNFIKEISPGVDYQYKKTVQIINTGLSLIYKEITSIHLESIQHCISLLDKEAQIHYTKQIDLISSELQIQFTKHREPLPSYVTEFIAAVNPNLESLVKNGWNDIYWENVIKFKEKVYSEIDKIITVVFNDRVELATKSIEQLIAFYNYFLERQDRYQQETPEQRKAEKAWIDKQRQELLQVKIGIDAILNER